MYFELDNEHGVIETSFSLYIANFYSKHAD